MPTETWTRLPEERRATVLAAAEAEFARNGYSRGSLNVIAREAGVAKGSLFQYFDDKMDLFAHLSELAVARVGEAMAELVETLDWDAGFFEAYAALADGWVQYFVEHPIDRSLSAAVFLEPDPDAHAAVREIVDRNLIDFLRPLVDHAIETGWIRADADVDAFLTLQLLTLPHLALAPSHPELDPLLDLGIDPAPGVRRLVAVLRAAFGT